MRKNFVVFVLIPLLLLGVVLSIFLDGWIESALEAGGESLVGARVEIDDLSLSLSPLGIRFARMQVANPNDPWKNLFETRTVQFAMNAGQLLRGKYIIEVVEVQDVIIGTRRTTDGSLPRRDEAATAGASRTFSAMAEEVLSRGIEKTPIFDPAVLRKGINIDSLVKAADLQSLRHLDTLTAQAQAATRQWPALLADIEQSKRRIADIDSSIRSINPAALKDVASITAAIKTVDDARRGAADILATTTARRDAIQTDIQNLSTSVGLIDDIVADDFAKVLNLARLPDINAMGIAEALLGKQLLDDVRIALGYVDLAREKIAAYSPKPAMEKPPRLEGQDIHFPVERAYPKFWIQTIRISGGTDATQEPEFFHARGEIRNISNDQRVTGQPITADLDASRGQTVTGSLKLLFDRTQDTPLDRYTATIAGVPLASFTIGRPDFLPATITGARLDAGITVDVPGRSFDGQSSVSFRNLSVAYAAPPANIGERLAREVLDGVKGFDVDLRLWNTAGVFKLALATDLDKQFAARVTSVVGAELNRLRAEIRSRVTAIIEPKRKAVESLVASKRAEAEQALAQYKSAIDGHLSSLEAKKKELEERLEKEKKGRLDDAMKKIFKR